MIFNKHGLALVVVPWPWAIVLKLACYMKQDLVDCAVALHLSLVQCGICWMLAGLEQWIMECCWLMGYTGFLPLQKQQLWQRIQDALNWAFPHGSQGVPVLHATSDILLYLSWWIPA